MSKERAQRRAEREREAAARQAAHAAAQERAEAAIVLAMDQGFPIWVALAHAMLADTPLLSSQGAPVCLLYTSDAADD